MCPDQEITCLDCGRAFPFTAREQAYYTEKGYREPPRRCLSCRKERRRQRVGRGEPT